MINLRLQNTWGSRISRGLTHIGCTNHIGLVLRNSPGRGQEVDPPGVVAGPRLAEVERQLISLAVSWSLQRASASSRAAERLLVSLQAQQAAVLVMGGRGCRGGVPDIGVARQVLPEKSFGREAQLTRTACYRQSTTSL
mmetsp:Transcript_116741/g.206656  ORF Transcript_116741/g.206656 Transcript_116741/m.206656 type:complete len:139 (-) Transcript_116741:13-429(-)